MLHRAQWLLLSALLFMISAPLALYASSKGDRVQIGKSIIIEENEQVGDVVCIGCSIRMSESCGDVVAIGGSIIVDGTVKGDAVAVGGEVRLRENASIAGDVVTVGGGLNRSPGATVRGDVKSQPAAPIVLAMVLVPLIPVILVVALIVWLLRRNRPPEVRPV